MCGPLSQPLLRLLREVRAYDVGLVTVPASVATDMNLACALASRPLRIL